MYNYIYPVSISYDYWRWHNIENPAGQSIIETAWDGGRLAGVYGLSPRWLSVRGERVYGALSDIAITHPDYRYRGIFSALGKSLYRRAEESGIKILYGFPTEHSRHGFKTALGWNCLCGCREMACWACGKGGSREGPDGVCQVQEVGDVFDLLWRRLAGGLFRQAVLVARDSRYLEWRFLNHPGEKYQIYTVGDDDAPGGYMAVRQAAEGGEVYGDIADIAAVDVHSFRRLVYYALAYYSSAGCVRMRLPAGSLFYHSAVAMGFRETGTGYYFGCRLLKNFHEQPLNWYFTMADAGQT
jgi:GNAT superfamily N-acetyltransferase